MMNDETKSMTIMKDSFLTNEEKWHFELQGYLVLDNIIPESDLKILSEYLTSITGQSFYSKQKVTKSTDDATTGAGSGGPAARSTARA